MDTPIIGQIFDAYKARADHDKEVKRFLAPRARRNSARAPKGKEPSNPQHRMYMKPGDYLDQHGDGRNIIRSGYGKTDETP